MSHTEKYTVILAVLLTLMPARVTAEDELPSAEALEAMGAVVGEVTYDRQNVFDPTQPGENKSLFRLANRWHIVTRESVIRQQLLFRPGDKFSVRLIEESERLLRQNSYLYDVDIEPVRVENGIVDIHVRTRDLWTLMPGFSASRSGGENRTGVKISERNLLGRGMSLQLSYNDDVDRESTSFQFYDRNLGASWTSMFLELADNSDGHTTDVRVVRPFYALDSLRSGGVTFFEDAREETFYELGHEAAEYDAETDRYTGFVGWSGGLQKGWVRRWSAGMVHDEQHFTSVVDGVLPPLIPADRTLIYPFFGFELIEDKFESASNRDHIERTEDFFLGTSLFASVGYATNELGSDRDSLIYRVEAHKGFGSIGKKALILSSSVTGRFDNGDAANNEISFDARYYNQISEKRLFS